MCQLPTSANYLTIPPMTVLARYLTHPQVKIDPDVPVPLWGLSALGRARTETLANTGYFSGTTQIISSGERKAIETAEVIAGKLNVAVEVREAMRENDRSATGHRPRQCSQNTRRFRQSHCRELHFRFDPEGDTVEYYPPLYFRPWLVVTPKSFIP
jgi:broad specificity phosphatase PhoE